MVLEIWEYLEKSSSIKVNGDINMDTRDTVAIYSHYSELNLNGKSNIKIKS